MASKTRTLSQLLTVADPNPDRHAYLHNLPLDPDEPATTAWHLPDGDLKDAARSMAQQAGWSVVDSWAWSDERGRWEIEIQIQNTVETA